MLHMNTLSFLNLKNMIKRELILNIIKEKYIDEKHIFVMDRGYMKIFLVSPVTLYFLF